MQANTTREKILKNIMELEMDRKLFLKISFDIAEMQIKKLWDIWLVCTDWHISTYSGLPLSGTSGIIPQIVHFPPYEYYRKLERIQRPSVTEWSYLTGRAGGPKLGQLNMMNSDFWRERQCVVLTADYKKRTVNAKCNLRQSKMWFEYEEILSIKVGPARLWNILPTVRSVGSKAREWPGENCFQRLCGRAYPYPANRALTVSSLPQRTCSESTALALWRCK